jgi:hypothetical protein
MAEARGLRSHLGHQPPTPMVSSAPVATLDLGAALVDLLRRLKSPDSQSHYAAFGASHFAATSTSDRRGHLRFLRPRTTGFGATRRAVVPRRPRSVVSALGAVAPHLGNGPLCRSCRHHPRGCGPCHHLSAPAAAEGWPATRWMQPGQAPDGELGADRIRPGLECPQLPVRYRPMAWRRPERRRCRR